MLEYKLITIGDYHQLTKFSAIIFCEKYTKFKTNAMKNEFSGEVNSENSHGF